MDYRTETLDFPETFVQQIARISKADQIRFIAIGHSYHQHQVCFGGGVIRIRIRCMHRHGKEEWRMRSGVCVGRLEFEFGHRHGHEHHGIEE